MLLAWACLMLSGVAAAAGTMELAAATRSATLTDGTVLPARPLTLPDYWDREQPGKSGTLAYELRFDRNWPAADPGGLFVPWAGGSYEVRVNGVLIAAGGRLDAPSSALAKRPYYVAVPPELARAHGNLLRITVAARAYARSGLLPVTVGPAAEVRAQFEQAFRLRVVGPLIAAVLSVVLGGLALLIWWRQRDPLFGLYGLAEVAWSVRLLDYFVDDLAIPAELRSYIVAAAREVFLGAIARFCLLVIRVPWRWLHRTLNAYLWLALPVVAPLAAMSSHPMVFPLSWLVKVGIILTVAGAMVWGALRRPSREATLLAATVGVSALLFLADWIKVWLTGDYYWVHSMTRYVSVPFSVVMAWMLVERYTSAVQSLQDANQVLTERVAQREAQLRAAFARTQKIAAEETALRERGRILRDMHDGLGSQLVTTISMLESGKASSPEIAVQVRHALDSLKLSIDAMQDTGGDLAAVLGNLRYRLGPRIADGGLDIHWEVERLPALAHFTARKVQELQYLLLEGITNVLQHARATALTVTAHADMDAQVIRITLADNGRGFDTGATRGGRGLRNMQVRAAAIGGRLQIRSAPGSTALTVEVPLAPGDGEEAGTDGEGLAPVA
ncbi:signal transduction histidine kinase [Cupriavidus necator H16]|uniref:histidine kinase n=1 Tax=Cupriavidus necator (strain ATCC 17699 / DSM 428 / KCTC 22496 / NCIMB 10442 / H16 / Stanier 337) TaxID=381666 RepID=Q0JYU4_CUPNH|nr:signal transduction histidine kinase [Cupriavidus necator H16]